MVGRIVRGMAEEKWKFFEKTLAKYPDRVYSVEENKIPYWVYKKENSKLQKGRHTMEQYNVTGMSCAACQTRVEKAVSKVPVSHPAQSAF